MIYFDNAASSRRSESFVREYIRIFKSLKKRTPEEESRLLSQLENKIAKHLGVLGRNISFTPNATYALNEIAYFLNSEVGDRRVFISESEHSSNHVIWQKLFKKISYFPLDSLTTHIFPEEPSIITFSILSNLEGILIDLDEAEKVFKNTRHLLIADASQYIQHSIPRLPTLPFSYLVFSAHKAFGPNGIGVIYSKEGKDLGISSRNHEYRHKDYELDYHAVEAWVKTIDESWNYVKSKESIKKERELRNYFADNFPENNFIRIANTDSGSCIFLMEIISPDISAHDFVFFLSRKGIVVRSGVSCSWLTIDKFDSRKIFRISLNSSNTLEEIDYFFKILKDFKAEKCF